MANGWRELIGNSQIWTLPLDERDGQLKAGKPGQFLTGQFNDNWPRFSPDGPLASVWVERVWEL